MGAGVLGALVSMSPARRPAEVVVANRTTARAASLARAVPPGVNVSTVDMGHLPDALAAADVVVAAVEAEAHVVTADHLVTVDRGGRPLLIVDLGMPRNVEPAAGDLRDVTLLDMGHLSSAVAQAMAERRVEAEAASEIVGEEVARYRAATRARGAAPVVAALRTRLEDLRAAELERRRGQFSTLSDDDWAQVDAATRAALAKLVHEPTVLLKETAGTPRGERLVEALRLLFDL
jgi:glutamyl-tRNA reductase